MKDIRKESLEELVAWFEAQGEEKFRARQLWEWLWSKSVTSFDAISSLSKPIRDKLKQEFVFQPVVVDGLQVSGDSTVKFAFKLHDKHLIEGVLIPSNHLMTACVSSQVGCSLNCKFCATGYMERERNLEASEIYDQVVIIGDHAKRHYQKPLTNIVFMGMGEPLLNYKEVMEGIDRITSRDGLNISPRRITVSTAGIAKMIVQLADDQVKFNLALSLHAADDQKRNTIMPINSSNSLDALMQALQYFYQKTGNRITLEYILFYDFNSSMEDAEKLLKYARRIPSRINIIEYNPIPEAPFTKAKSVDIDRFVGYLIKGGIHVSIRRSRGKDIDAACGQLANKRKIA